jgi:hypothetical protein
VVSFVLFLSFAKVLDCLQCHTEKGAQVCSRCHHFKRNHKGNDGRHRCIEKVHVLSECPTNYERGHTAEKKVERAKFKNNKIDGTSMNVFGFIFFI